MRRILYLWLPQWPIDRRRRSAALSCRGQKSVAPADEAPFATVIDANGRRQLAAVNPAAAAAGLAPGMPLADALSFVPGLATTLAEPTKDAAALRRLAEWCGRYSPWTAPDMADGVKIEITGCAHLWGGETALAADLIARLTRQGITGRLAIADTLGTAWACARFAETGRSPMIVPGGTTRAALVPLPVEALRLDPATAQGLRRVGLRQIGDLYAMPRIALARRFGEAVIQRLDQALGDLPEPLSPTGETPARRVRLSFAEPIADPADLVLATERLAEDLVSRLARDGSGARRLVLACHRIDGRVERIVLGTARPSRDPHHIAALFKERLDTVDPGLGIEDMILAAFAVEPLDPEQFSFLRAPSPSGSGQLPGATFTKTRVEAPLSDCSAVLDTRLRSDNQQRRAAEGAQSPKAGDVSALLDRLGNRLGLAAVCRFETRESHIPERSSVAVSLTLPSTVFSPSTPAALSNPEFLPGKKRENDSESTPRPGPVRPIRLFDPPQPIEAAWLLPDDPPFRFTWRRRAHRVRRADGPERIAAEWWRCDQPGGVGDGLSRTRSKDADAVRDYYWVEDEEGRRFWLFRAGLPEVGHPLRWYVHGVFA